MKCIRCQAENEEGAKFCKDCGNDLTVNVDAPTNESLKNLSDELNSKANLNKKEPVNINKIIAEFPKKLLSWILFPFKKLGKKKTIIISSIIVVVALISVLCVKFVVPYAPHYFKANTAFKNQEYTTAFEEYELSKNFLNSKSKLNDVHYSYAESLYNDGKYTEASEQYVLVENYDGIDARLKECGTKVLESKNYEQASKILEKVKDDSAKPLKNYADAMTKFNSANYADAKSLFGQTNNYNDSQIMISACDLMEAEKHCKDSNFTKAKEIYASLPQDFEYNGISASARLNLLNNSQSLLDAMGTYKATANYIESRNIYRRNGSWDNWYIDQVESGQTLKLSCKLNSSNTFDIEGTVTFYKFNNYSSLSSACQAKQTSRSIEIKNVTSIPSTYQLDSYTTLTYSGGVFKLKYSQRDDYSAYFYNMYNSSVTYGK